MTKLLLLSLVATSFVPHYCSHQFSKISDNRDATKLATQSFGFHFVTRTLGAVILAALPEWLTDGDENRALYFFAAETFVALFNVLDVFAIQIIFHHFKASGIRDPMLRVSAVALGWSFAESLGANYLGLISTLFGGEFKWAILQTSFYSLPAMLTQFAVCSAVFLGDRLSVAAKVAAVVVPCVVLPVLSSTRHFLLAAGLVTAAWLLLAVQAVFAVGLFIVYWTLLKSATARGANKKYAGPKSIPFATQMLRWISSTVSASTTKAGNKKS